MRSDRGATLVEYALGLSVLVLAISGAAAGLQAAGSSEVDNQANCISERPPPEDCLVRLVTTTTTVVPEPGDPPDPEPEPPPPPPPPTPATVEWAEPSVTGTPGAWRAQATIELALDDPPGPLQGALVRVRVTLTDPPNPTPFFLTCTTDADGRCSVAFDVLDPARNGISFVLDDVVPPQGQGSVESPILSLDIPDPGPLPFTAPT